MKVLRRWNTVIGSSADEWQGADWFVCECRDLDQTSRLPGRPPLCFLGLQQLSGGSSRCLKHLGWVWRGVLGYGDQMSGGEEALEDMKYFVDVMIYLHELGYVL